ncbi:MAG: hypothetical protein GX030_03385 [Firmicutes bacterium]|nr:hypothetical protein [Bacillota bacterium]
MPQTKTFGFVLTSAEGKRLIAKGVAALPCVQQALAEGTIIIGYGTTNGFIAEELTGQPIDKGRYAAGIVAGGQWTVTDSDSRLPTIVLEKGTTSSTPWLEALANFTADDVFIKGANAIDLEGNAGVLVGSPTAGTCGAALGTVYASGAHLVVPVSLEKLIPSVPLAVQTLGISRLDECTGLKVGMYPMVGGEIITEVEALELLFDVEAVAVSAGGIGGSEGAIGLAVTGYPETIDEVKELIDEIQGEAALPDPR